MAPSDLQPEHSANSSAAAAADSRMPLPVVLETLAEDLDDRRLKQAIDELRARLEQGASIDEALDQLSDRTPRYLRGVLQAATTSGELAEVCENFVRVRETSRDAWYALRQVIAYPLLLLAALTGLALIVSQVLLPAFRGIFEEFDLELPPITNSLLHAGPFLSWFMVAALVVWLLIVLAPRVLGAGHTLQAALPGLGTVFACVHQQQFAQTLAGFVRMRLPLDQALVYTGDMLENRTLRRATHEAAAVVKRGGTLASYMAGSRHFDRTLTTMTGWGEQRSQLAESLDVAGEMFVDRRAQRMQLLVRVTPPLTLVLAASTAASVASALVLPLIKLIEGLS